MGLTSFIIWLRVTKSQQSHMVIHNVKRALFQHYESLTRYAKLPVAHAPGMPGMVSPPPRYSDPDMHHGTCVTHVPWSMSGSLTSGFLWSRCRGNFPGIPGACVTHNFTYLARGPCIGRYDRPFWFTCILKAAENLIIFQHCTKL